MKFRERGVCDQSQSGGSRRRQEGLRQWGSLAVRGPAPPAAFPPVPGRSGRQNACFWLRLFHFSLSPLADLLIQNLIDTRVCLLTYWIKLKLCIQYRNSYFNNLYLCFLSNMLSLLKKFVVCVCITYVLVLKLLKVVNKICGLIMTEFTKQNTCKYMYVYILIYIHTHFKYVSLFLSSILYSVIR